MHAHIVKMLDEYDEKTSLHSPEVISLSVGSAAEETGDFVEAGRAFRYRVSKLDLLYNAYGQIVGLRFLGPDNEWVSPSDHALGVEEDDDDDDWIG